MEQNLFSVFFTIFFAEFAAEFGDKTQLILVGMTSKYKMRQIILGFLPAVILLNAIAVFIGGALNQILNSYLWSVKFVAAVAFMYFAFSSFFKEECEGGEKECKMKFATFAIFWTFFVAELGDKTQLTALTFGANYGLSGIFTVFLACVAGFFAADFIGMMIGLLLKKRVPDSIMKILSFVLFAFFSFYTFYQALVLLQQNFFAKGLEVDIPIFVIMSLIFACFCCVWWLTMYLKKRKLSCETSFGLVEFQKTC